MIANTLIFVTSFLVVLSLIVFIHEMGHYGVAKLFGTKIDRFSVGFGKPIFKKTLASGEEWVVSSLPLGGYVKFAGDETAFSSADHDKLKELAKQPGAEDLFQFKPLWQRALIVAAGPAANFILAIVIFAGMLMAYGEYVTKTEIFEVIEDSPAQAAGFLPGDRFVAIDDKIIDTSIDVMSYVSLRAGESLNVIVERDGREITLPVTPERKMREDAIGGQTAMGTMGVRMRQELVETIDYGPLEALGRGTQQLGETIAMTGHYAGRIFQGKEDGKAFGGVLRIFAMTGKVAVDGAAPTAEGANGAVIQKSMGERVRATALRLLNLMALLSIGLGIANLVPIPALDGGHLLYYSYEAVAGRPLSPQAQDLGYRLGIAVLVGLFVILTFNDIGYIRSLLS